MSFASFIVVNCAIFGWSFTCFLPLSLVTVFMASSKVLDLSRDGRKLRLRMVASDLLESRLSRAFHAGNYKMTDFVAHYFVVSRLKVYSQCAEL